MQAKSIIILLIFSIVSIAWFNPKTDKIKTGNRLYKEGKYDEAMEHYTDVLIDLPQSPYVHYNVGASAYKKGDYENAVEAYTKCVSTDNLAIEEKGYYSIGNCKYKQGERKESTDVTEAIKLYREALDAYKRAIDLNSKNMDAKFNYEVVQRKIKEFQDQQQQQNQQQDSSQQDPGKQEQQEENSQRDDSQEADSQEEQQQESQQGAQEQKDVEKKASAQAADEKEEMTKAEALRLLDALKDEEQHQLILQHKRDTSFPEDFKDW